MISSFDLEVGTGNYNLLQDEFATNFQNNERRFLLSFEPSLQSYAYLIRRGPPKRNTWGMQHRRGMAFPFAVGCNTPEYGKELVVEEFFEKESKEFGKRGKETGNKGKQFYPLEDQDLTEQSKNRYSRREESGRRIIHQDLTEQSSNTRRAEQSSHTSLGQEKQSRRTRRADIISRRHVLFRGSTGRDDCSSVLEPNINSQYTCIPKSESQITRRWVPCVNLREIFDWFSSFGIEDNNNGDGVKHNNDDEKDDDKKDKKDDDKKDKKYFIKKDVNFLKIDAQGFDHQVLLSAGSAQADIGAVEKDFFAQERGDAQQGKKLFTEGEVTNNNSSLIQIQSLSHPPTKINVKTSIKKAAQALREKVRKLQVEALNTWVPSDLYYTKSSSKSTSSSRLQSWGADTYASALKSSDVVETQNENNSVSTSSSCFDMHAKNSNSSKTDLLFCGSNYPYREQCSDGDGLDLHRAPVGGDSYREQQCSDGLDLHETPLKARHHRRQQVLEATSFFYKNEALSRPLRCPDMKLLIEQGFGYNCNACNLHRNESYVKRVQALGQTMSDLEIAQANLELESDLRCSRREDDPTIFDTIQQEDHVEENIRKNVLETASLDSDHTKNSANGKDTKQEDHVEKNSRKNMNVLETTTTTNTPESASVFQSTGVPETALLEVASVWPLRELVCDLLDKNLEKKKTDKRNKTCDDAELRSAYRIQIHLGAFDYSYRSENDYSTLSENDVLENKADSSTQKADSTQNQKADLQIQKFVLTFEPDLYRFSSQIAVKDWAELQQEKLNRLLDSEKLEELESHRQGKRAVDWVELNRHSYSDEAIATWVEKVRKIPKIRSNLGKKKMSSPSTKIKMSNVERVTLPIDFCGSFLAESSGETMDDNNVLSSSATVDKNKIMKDQDIVVSSSSDPDSNNMISWDSKNISYTEKGVISWGSWDNINNALSSSSESDADSINNCAENSEKKK